MPLKRNLALALAVRSRWQYMLLLDDDISAETDRDTLDPDGLRRALDELATNRVLRAVSWVVEAFPDNSVIGHARRLVGDPQKVFASSGALLLRCDTRTPLFPPVYNEDWLFFIANAARNDGFYRHRLARGGFVRQLAYDPFQEARAESEEAGDILAEALMNALEDDGPSFWPTVLDRRFWAMALKARAGMIETIFDRLDGSTDAQTAACTALLAALQTHPQISAEMLRSFVVDWRADLRTWRGYLRQLSNDDAARTCRSGS